MARVREASPARAIREKSDDFMLSRSSTHGGIAMHGSPEVPEIDHPAPFTWPDDGLSAFLRTRPRLFGIAYRMLGSVAEAEDVVQDVWLRWQTTDRSQIRDPLAFLVTATTRLALNVLDTNTSPALDAERGEALNAAMRLLLEKLLPTERAAYVLREAFNYSYRRIAEILRVEEANTRQLVTRARKRLSGGRRAAVIPAEQRRLLEAFDAAARTGDLARLESLFCHN
jgi:RNA polymerase sigma factor (sigma-70 family)